MQSNRLMLVIAVVAGVVATLAAFAYLQSASGAVARQVEPSATVLVAKRDLPADHILDPAEDLREQRVPAVTFESMARATVKFDERNALRGRRINAPIPAGSPILYSQLVGIADLNISAGSRAVTIRVDETGMIGGILVPGDRVDLIVSWPLPQDEPTGPAPTVDLNNPTASISAILGQVMQNSGGQAEWGARPLLSNVRVLAVGDRLTSSREQFMFGETRQRNSRTASTITVEVTLEEALDLVRAMGGGRNTLTVLLRPVTAAAPGTAGGSTLE